MSLPDFNICSGRSLPWLVAQRASLSANRPFLIFHPFNGDAQTLTYVAFARRVDQLAAGLAAQGISKGDFVIIHLENCLEFVVSWFACSRIGAVAVTTNVHSAEGELSYFAEQSGAVSAITQPSLFETVRRGAKDLRWIACVDHNAGEAPKRMPTEGDFIPFESLLSEAGELPEVELHDSDINSIMFTSGTTSRPKGVVYTHANVLWAAQRNAAHFELNENDIAYCFLPLFHANALSWQMLATLWAGAAIVIQPRFSASRFWAISGQHRCTWSSIAHFVVLALRDHPDPDSHQFRFWGNPVGRADEVMGKWGIPVLGWYGMTETVSQPILSDLRFPSEHYTMGRAMPEYELAVVDEEGMPVHSGGIGELKVRGIRGLSLFAEYLHDPDATAASFDEDGWFRTGDMVELFEDGTLAFANRDKDMMKVGGENVAASEVESVIDSLDGVLESAVVGKPDPFLYEIPIAFVVPLADEAELVDQIMAICKQQLATFKHPREIVFVESLPRLTIGKMDKKVLRERVRSGEQTD